MDKASATEDVICPDDAQAEPSEAHAGGVADWELHTEDLATGDDLEHMLNPFYVADAELFKRAQDPSVSFMELLMGDEATGFSLDHEVLEESYVPVDAINVPMGGLGGAAGASFSARDLVASLL